MDYGVPDLVAEKLNKSGLFRDETFSGKDLEKIDHKGSSIVFAVNSKEKGKLVVKLLKKLDENSEEFSYRQLLSEKEKGSSRLLPVFYVGENVVVMKYLVGDNLREFEFDGQGRRKEGAFAKIIPVSSSIINRLREFEFDGQGRRKEGAFAKIMLESSSIIDELRDVVYSDLKYLLGDLWRLHYGKNIVHMDIRPENIMCDDRGGMTIIGFGKSKHIGPYGMVYNDKGEIAAVSLGTGVPNHYLPPEYKPNTPCDYRKLDIWALGITILETLLSFNDAKIQAVLAAIRQSDQKQSSDIIDREIGGQQISPEFWKIMLKGMLNPDPTKRFSADEATNILLSLERSDAAKSKERDGKEKRDKVSEVREVKEEEKKGEEKKGEEEGKRKIEGEKRRVEEKKRRAEEENRKIREKNRRMREENRKIREKNKKMKEEIRKIEGEGRGDEIDPYRGHSRETGGSTLRFPGDVLRLGYTHDYFIIKRAGEEIEDLYILDKGKSMGIPGK